MAQVAGLAPNLRSVADLEQPMTRLGTLGPSLDATAALGGPMARLAGMRPSLDAVARLQPSLDQVASLDTQLASVAALEPAMKGLGGACVSRSNGSRALEGPMSRLRRSARSSIVLAARRRGAAWTRRLGRGHLRRRPVRHRQRCAGGCEVIRRRAADRERCGRWRQVRGQASRLRQAARRARPDQNVSCVLHRPHPGDRDRLSPRDT